MPGDVYGLTPGTLRRVQDSIRGDSSAPPPAPPPRGPDPVQVLRVVGPPDRDGESPARIVYASAAGEELSQEVRVRRVDGEVGRYAGPSRTGEFALYVSTAAGPRAGSGAAGSGGGGRGSGAGAGGSGGGGLPQPPCDAVRIPVGWSVVNCKVVATSYIWLVGDFAVYTADPCPAAAGSPGGP